MSKLKVLVAEDDPTMVNLLNTLLEMEGFDVLALDADEDVAHLYPLLVGGGVRVDV